MSEPVFKDVDSATEAVEELLLKLTLSGTIRWQQTWPAGCVVRVGRTRYEYSERYVRGYLSESGTQSVCKFTASADLEAAILESVDANVDGLQELLTELRALEPAQPEEPEESEEPDEPAVAPVPIKFDDPVPPPHVTFSTDAPVCFRLRIPGQAVGVLCRHPSVEQYGTAELLCVGDVIGPDAVLKWLLSPGRRTTLSLDADDLLVELDATIYGHGWTATDAEAAVVQGIKWHVHAAWLRRGSVPARWDWLQWLLDRGRTQHPGAWCDSRLAAFRQELLVELRRCLPQTNFTNGVMPGLEYVEEIDADGNIRHARTHSGIPGRLESLTVEELAKLLPVLRSRPRDGRYAPYTP